MKPVKAVRSILAGLYKSFRRFPVTILFSAGACAILIVKSEMSGHAADGLIYSRLAMILSLGIFLSLCAKMYYERIVRRSRLKLVLLYSVTCLMLALYYVFLLNRIDMVSSTRYGVCIAVLILAFLYIPYLWNRERYERYIIVIISGFFITAICSGVLFGGLAAILFTVDKLLGITVASKVYYYTFLIVAFTFAPMYFLSGVPEYGQNVGSENYPKLLKILLLYIVMPLLTAYTAILYIYFIKIIATRQWPVGLVSNLVLWYAIIVTASIFFIAPIRAENRWGGLFSRWMPEAILPLLAMMFVSMGIRVNAYGITENRYYVLVLGIWITCIMIYFSSVKNLRNIVIPFTLSIIALLSVFGPLSSYSVSMYSQNMRLKSILVSNDMLKDGRIQPNPNVSDKDRSEVSRILDYFGSSHSYSEVRYLPRGFTTENMKDVFGFGYESTGSNSADRYFYYMNSSLGGPIDIAGYDYLIDGRWLYGKQTAGTGNLDAVYDQSTSVLKINYNGNIIYEKDLNDFITGLADKYGTGGKDTRISPDDMVLVDSSGRADVKIFFTSISGNRNSSSGRAAADGVDFYLLLRVK